MKDHRLIDERSLAFGRLIAEKLRANPQLRAIGRENLDRWLGSASPRALPALREWRQLIDAPLSELLAVLLATDERAIRLAPIQSIRRTPDLSGTFCYSC